MWTSKRSGTVSARRSTRLRCHPRCEVLEGRALLATFHVADVAGLQAAVTVVNANPNELATIVMEHGTYDLAGVPRIEGASNLTIEAEAHGKVVLENHSGGSILWIET